jgi:hypothetical protein
MQEASARKETIIIDMFIFFMALDLNVRRTG